jgi:hypothetical protein
MRTRLTSVSCGAVGGSLVVLLFVVFQYDFERGQASNSKAQDRLSSELNLASTQPNGVGTITPPKGMALDKEVLIVTDFRDLASGVASDLASNRLMLVAQIQQETSVFEAASKAGNKEELQRSRAKLDSLTINEQHLDERPWTELLELPSKNVIERLPLSAGKMLDIPTDQSSQLLMGKQWVFARAVRSDGRVYWELKQVDFGKNPRSAHFTIGPDDFISTKSILRPDLSPKEQAK